MTDDRGPTLEEVALAAGDALRRHGIAAVLTGGACASIHSKGRYVSADVDFVLTMDVKLSALDEALGEAGFVRKGDRYIRHGSPFWIEFPRGPLAIGGDHALRPVLLSRRRSKTLALSATDSCRDRLAAFYHWNDRQALEVAVSIALLNALHYPTIKRWSLAEAASAKYEEFLRATRHARRKRID